MQTGSDENSGGICDKNSKASTVTVSRHLLALCVIACDFKTGAEKMALMKSCCVIIAEENF